MRSVYREYPIEMIDLVLQQFRTVTLELGFVRLAPQVMVAHPDAVRSQHPHQQVGVGEAVIPYGEILVTDVDDLRVYEYPGLVHLDVDEAERCADLGSRDAAAAAVTRLPVMQGVGEVIDHDPNRRRLRVGDHFAAFAQDRVAKKADSTDGHGAKVGPAERTVNYPRTTSRDLRLSKALTTNEIWRFRRLAAMPTVMLAAGLAACSDGTGGSTPTSQIVPDFSISAAPNTITFVIGQFAADQFSSIHLPDNDVLSVSAAGQDKPMRWSLSPLGSGYYAASLTQLDPGTTITIALTRSDGGNAPDSQVTMPEPLALTAPAEGIIESAGNNLEVSWNPSGTADQMQVVLRSVRCTRPGAGATQTVAVVGDPGSATVLIDPELLPPLGPGRTVRGRRAGAAGAAGHGGPGVCRGRA